MLSGLGSRDTVYLAGTSLDHHVSVKWIVFLVKSREMSLNLRKQTKSLEKLDL